MPIKFNRRLLTELGLLAILLSFYMQLHTGRSRLASSIFGFLAALLYITLLKFKPHELGIDLKKPGKWSIVALGMVIIVAFYELSRNTPIRGDFMNLIYFGVLSGISQELFFRGIIPAIFKRLEWKFIAIALVQMVAFLFWHQADFKTGVALDDMFTIVVLMISSLVWYLQSQNEKTVIWASLSHICIDLLIIGFDPRY